MLSRVEQYANVKLLVKPAKIVVEASIWRRVLITGLKERRQIIAVSLADTAHQKRMPSLGSW